MNMLHVATALNAGGRPAESGKKGKDSGEVTDDFKKFLQEKNGDTENTSNDPKVDKKDVKESKDEAGDTVKEGSEEGGQEMNPDGLLVSYQMDMGWRPQMLQAETDPAAAAVEGENLIALAEEPQAETEVSLQPAAGQPVEAQMSAAVQEQPKEKDADTKFPANLSQNPPQTVERPVVSKSTDKISGVKQEETVQTDIRGAEQVAQAPVQQTRTETVREAEPQETVRMHVPQPEELPEKLTDQLLSKLADGVKEFEIQIEPVNLGKIAVKISYENGQANISILCSEKKALDVLGQNVKEICGVIERNFGGSTTIILDKPENDYLNQARDENGQGRQNQEQEQQKEGKQQQSEDDAEQFLQKLRLGLVG